MGMTPLRRNEEIQKISAVTGTPKACISLAIFGIYTKNTKLNIQACWPNVTYQLLQLGV